MRCSQSAGARHCPGSGSESAEGSTRSVIFCAPPMCLTISRWSRPKAWLWVGAKYTLGQLLIVWVRRSLLRCCGVPSLRGYREGARGRYGERGGDELPTYLELSAGIGWMNPHAGGRASRRAPLSCLCLIRTRRCADPTHPHTQQAQTPFPHPPFGLRREHMGMPDGRAPQMSFLSRTEQQPHRDLFLQLGPCLKPSGTRCARVWLLKTRHLDNYHAPCILHSPIS